ncbi:MAG: iron ABC transporter permease [Verrucomicrobiota bacterium]
MRWGAFSSTTWWRALAWACGLALLLPIASLLVSLVRPLPEGNSWEHVLENTFWPAARLSLFLTLGVCLLSCLLAIPAAWCISNYRFFGRQVWAVLLVLPLAVPTYIAAYVTTESREALIPWLVSLRRDHGIETYLLWESYSRHAILALMMAAVLSPYIFLAARSAFSSEGRRAAEAARLLGAGPWKTFFSISLPIARPALVAGLSLVAFEVLNDYGAVKHFGVPTVTVGVFRTWFGYGEAETAARFAGWVLLAVLLLAALERWQRGRSSHAAAGPPPPLRSASPLVSVLSWLACGAPVALGLGFPLAVLGSWQTRSTYAQPFGDFLGALGNSLLLGALVTAACLLLALIVVGAARMGRGRGEAALARLGGIAGYATPGAVMALGIFSLAALLRSWFPGASGWGGWLLSGSFFWLVYALAARYFAVGGQLTRQGLDSISLGLDRAAACLGRGPLASFVSVHLPLLAPALAAAAVLLFVDVCKELPLTLLLRPFGFETLATRTYGIVDEGRIFACAAPSLLLVLLCAGGLAVVETLGWRRHRS